MRIGLLVIAALALVGFVAVAFVLPQMAGSDAKEAGQLLISGSDAAKQQVTAVVSKSGSLATAGTGIKIAPKSHAKHGEMKWIVENNGTVRGWNEKNAIEISLTPSLQGKNVNWSCRGYPNTAMPVSCGGR